MSDRKKSHSVSVSKRVARDAKCSIIVAKSHVDAMRRIMLGYDGSEESRKVLSFAALLGKKFGAGVDVLTVVSTEAITSESDLEKSTVGHEHEPARASFAEAVSSLKRDGISTERSKLIGPGDVSRAIVSESERGSYDLIVVGSRGHGRLESILLGSVATGVIDSSSKTNVLIAR